MQTALRNLFLSAMVLAVATPLFAQSIRRVPEGGSELAYAVVAGISCLGAVWYRVRRK